MIVDFPGTPDIFAMLSQLKKAEPLRYSPVSYVYDLLEEYFNSSIEAEELSRKFIEQTREEQFLYSLLPQSEIIHNRQVFNKEFDFADELFAILTADDVGNNPDFRNSVIRCIQKYLSY